MAGFSVGRRMRKLTITDRLIIAGETTYGYLAPIGTDIKVVQGTGYTWRFTRPVNDLTLGNQLNVASQRCYPFKTVTTDPVLDDLANGEFIFGDAVNKRVWVRMGGVLYYATLTPV